MAEYIEILDIDTPDGDSILIAAWDGGANIMVSIISKETTIFPDDDGDGNLGRPLVQTGTSSIYLLPAEALRVAEALGAAIDAY